MNSYLFESLLGRNTYGIWQKWRHVSKLGKTLENIFHFIPVLHVSQLLVINNSVVGQNYFNDNQDTELINGLSALRELETKLNVLGPLARLLSNTTCDAKSPDYDYCGIFGVSLGPSPLLSYPLTGQLHSESIVNSQFSQSRSFPLCFFTLSFPTLVYVLVGVQGPDYLCVANCVQRNPSLLRVLEG